MILLSFIYYIIYHKMYTKCNIFQLKLKIQNLKILKFKNLKNTKQ